MIILHELVDFIEVIRIKAANGTQENMAYAIGLPFGLVLAYPWSTFWPSVGIPVGVPWRTSG